MKPDSPIAKILPLMGREATTLLEKAVQTEVQRLMFGQPPPIRKTKPRGPKFTPKKKKRK